MCCPVCESPSKFGSYLFKLIYFLSKAAIQQYAVTSEMKKSTMENVNINLNTHRK